MSEQIVACRVAGSEYAFRITSVREIIRDEGAVSIGGADPRMLGVVDLRGTAMPVLDLAATLQGRGSQARRAPHPAAALVEDDDGRDARRIVVTTRAGSDEVVGWLVDGVDEVITVGDSDIEALDRAASDVVHEVARAEGGRLLPLLDVDRLLDDESESSALRLAA